jgi:2-polyprenyl-6-methoxyphenol hydroxylase-like FAD-dependent oxidoreductase
MADVVVCGGGVVGLASAMLLARDGHEVTVLERDGGDVPTSVDEAWERWERPGVPQFRQPHVLLPGYRRIVEAELPDVFARLVDAGGTWVNFIEDLPPSITDREPRPGDDRFRFATGRRPMVEYVHASAAQDEPRVTVRRGSKVLGLVAGPRGDVPRVTGVVTEVGELRADLVVDAMGRRSPVAAWLDAVGARTPTVSSQDCGFTYYSRYFAGPQLPAMIAPLACPIGTFLILTLPGDNSTWSVTLWGPSGDRALKEFRDPEKFTKVVKACPLQAHWLDGTPTTDVLPMAGILDRYRRFVVDGHPVATGFASVGDAWACTNPSAGLGVSVGLLHAQRLRDVARVALDDPTTFAVQWDAVTEAELAPWYWNQLAVDQARLATMAANRDGGDGTLPALLPGEYEAASRAMLCDADVLRGVIESLTCLALPQEVFARPGMWDRVEAAATDGFPFPGPSRDELLRLLA